MCTCGVEDDELSFSFVVVADLEKKKKKGEGEGEIILHVIQYIITTLQDRRIVPWNEIKPQHANKSCNSYFFLIVFTFFFGGFALIDEELLLVSLPRPLLLSLFVPPEGRLVSSSLL